MENKNFNSLKALCQDLRRQANLRRAEISRKYFKTDKGEYAAGDKFLGVTAPQIRAIVKKYRRDFSIADGKSLL